MASNGNRGDVREAPPNVHHYPRRVLDCGLIGVFQDDDALRRELRLREDRDWLARQRNDLQARLLEHREQIKPRDILHLLPEEQLMEMQQHFPKGTQLKRKEFVEMMAREFSTCPGIRSMSELELQDALIDLFETMDVNGNQSVSWECFSLFFVSAYGAMQVYRNCITPYVANGVQVVRNNFRHGQMVHIPSLDSYVILGTVPVPLQYFLLIQDSKGTMVEIEKDGKYEMLATEYLPSLRQLVTSTSQNQLLFHEMRRDIPSKHMYRLRGTWWTEFNIGMLRWSDAADLLFGADTRHGWLMGYRLGNTELMGGTPIIRKRPHEATITDLLVLNEQNLLATCSLDTVVKMYDLQEAREMCVMGPAAKGHGKGVLSLTYSRAHNMMASSGYEFEPILWMPIPGRNQFISRLADPESPHKHTVRKVIFVPDSPELLSFDASGMVKVWDIRVCKVVQTFHMNEDAILEDTAAYAMLSAAHDARTRRISILGRSIRTASLYFWTVSSESEGHLLRAHDSGLVALLYHSSTHMFITADSNSVKLWGANRGHVVNSFAEVLALGNDTITCLTLDDHSRRFLLGTLTGAVSLHSLGTGQLSSRFQGHDCEVQLLQFCEQSRFHCIISFARSGVVHLYPAVGTSAAVVLPQRVIQLQGVPSHCAYSPKGNCLVVATDRESIAVHQLQGDMLLLKAECSTLGGEGLRAALGDRGKTTKDITALRANAQTHPGDAKEKPNNPPGLEVTALTMLLPHAAFLCGDTNGVITLWALPPSCAPYEPRAHFMLRVPQHDGSRAVAVSLQYNEARCLLGCGDDRGFISLWNMSEMLRNSMVGLMQNTFMPTDAGQQHGGGTPVIKPTFCTPPLVAAWAARCSITHLLFPSGKNFILTSSDEATVCIWGLKGELLGQLQQGRGIKQEGYTPYCVDDGEDVPRSPPTVSTFGAVCDALHSYSDGPPHRPTSVQPLSPSTLSHSDGSVSFKEPSPPHEVDQAEFTLAPTQLQLSFSQGRPLCKASQRQPGSPLRSSLRSPKSMPSTTSSSTVSTPVSFARQLSLGDTALMEQLGGRQLCRLSQRPPRVSVKTSPPLRYSSSPVAPLSHGWSTVMPKEYRRDIMKLKKLDHPLPRVITLTKMLVEGDRWCSADVSEKEVAGMLKMVMSPHAERPVTGLFNPHLQPLLVTTQEDRDLLSLSLGSPTSLSPPGSLSGTRLADGSSTHRAREECPQEPLELFPDEPSSPPALEADAIPPSEEHGGGDDSLVAVSPASSTTCLLPPTPHH
eukprot:GGOE01018434.1.p1 GENE.GGOE01018434.1~~GGOE01018434.1.p1  ORF type:complete len:1265 (-),score=377.12 GGOE01018434.1:334-4128(-)